MNLLKRFFGNDGYTKAANLYTSGNSYLTESPSEFARKMMEGDPSLANELFGEDMDHINNISSELEEILERRRTEKGNKDHKKD